MKPPVPQPQLKYSPSTGVLLMIGAAYGVMRIQALIEPIHRVLMGLTLSFVLVVVGWLVTKRHLLAGRTTMVIGFSLLNASGSISSRTRKIMAPAANPMRRGIRGWKNQEKMLAGTAASGWGKLVKQAARKQRGRLAPARLKGIAIAKPSGIL